MTSGYRLVGVMIRDYIHPGWNRRNRDGRLTPISGWRYVLHRILWGYTKLTYNKPVAAPTWQFEPDRSVTFNGSLWFPSDNTADGFRAVVLSSGQALATFPAIAPEWISVGSVA